MTSSKPLGKLTRTLTVLNMVWGNFIQTVGIDSGERNSSYDGGPPIGNREEGVGGRDGKSIGFVGMFFFFSSFLYYRGVYRGQQRFRVLAG